MDHYTVAKYYLEMKECGKHALDVSDLLLKEINDTSDFPDDIRSILLENIHKWQDANKREKTEIISRIKDLLFTNEQLKNIFADALTHCLQGGKIEDF